MKLPNGTIHSCPNCNLTSQVSYRDQGYLWVAETIWKCPHCKNYLSSKELDTKPKNK